MVALDRAARIGASTAPVEDRWDVYQDAWVKFLRWPPRNFGAAVTMTLHARDTLWRRNKYRQHEELTDMPGEGDPTADAALDLALIASIPPEIIALAIEGERGTKATSRRLNGAERIRLWRWRHQQ
jgi:hypothetical protein